MKTRTLLWEDNRGVCSQKNGTAAPFLFYNFLTGCCVKGTRPLNEAIVTGGGVNTREINPSTLESKIVKGLYFAGEVLDVDALTGGYNLQIAFSTGYLSGLSAAREPS